MISILTSLVGAFFIITALLKAFYSRLFIIHVRQFRLLPESPAALLAILFIEFEAGLGAAMILGIYPELLIPLAGSLIIFFTLLTEWGYRFRRLEDCGCYGGLVQPEKRQSLAINILLLLLLGISWYYQDLDQLTDPRRLYYVICLVLIVHLVAKKTIRKPPFDLLGMKAGKPWNQQWFNIKTEDLQQSNYLFFFLDRNCPLCRSWIELLARLQPEAFQCRMVVLLTASSLKSSEQVAISILKIPVHTIHEKVMRLLIGQLPLAVSVKAGIIKAKWSGSFPEAELLNHLIPVQSG